MVALKPIDASTKMSSLLQFLEGPALQAVLPYETLSNGLRKALTVLEERFGRPCQIVRACVDKLIKGPPIHYGDKEAIQRFADTSKATYETLRILELSKRDEYYPLREYHSETSQVLPSELCKTPEEIGEERASYAYI